MMNLTALFLLQPWSLFATPSTSAWLLSLNSVSTMSHDSFELLSSTIVSPIAPCETTNPAEMMKKAEFALHEGAQCQALRTNLVQWFDGNLQPLRDNVIKICRRKQVAMKMRINRLC